MRLREPAIAREYAGGPHMLWTLPAPTADEHQKAAGENDRSAYQPGHMWLRFAEYE